jgi:hypothetical protein
LGQWRYHLWAYSIRSTSQTIPPATLMPSATNEGRLQIRAPTCQAPASPSRPTGIPNR